MFITINENTLSQNILSNTIYDFSIIFRWPWYASLNTCNHDHPIGCADQVTISVQENCRHQFNLNEHYKANTDRLIM